MGYSATTRAFRTLEQIESLMKGRGATVSKGIVANEWTGFWEMGREQADGSIVGTIQKNVEYQGKTCCVRAGSFRIEPDGRLSRFPGLSKRDREDVYIFAHQ